MASTLLNGIVSYWKLDEASGNAIDSVGVNTLTNVNTATYSAGKINNAVNLSAASSQYLDITDASQVGLTPANFTISSWINISDLSAGRPIVTKNLTSGSWAAPYVSYMIRYDSTVTKFEFGVSDGTTYTPYAPVYTLTTATYYHVVAMYDGAILSIYVDGALVGSLAYTSVIGYGTGDFMLGSDNGAEYMDGSLDETGFWSRALTSTEVTELYNSGAGIQYPFLSPQTDNAPFFGCAF